MQLIIADGSADYQVMAQMVAIKKLLPGALILLPEVQTVLLRKFLKDKNIPDIIRKEQDIKEDIEELIVIPTAASKGNNSENRFLQASKISSGHDILAVMAEEGSTFAYSGTCSCLPALIKAHGLEISPDEALLFVLAIYEQTVYLTQNADSVVLKALSLLITCGFNPEEIPYYLNPGLAEKRKIILEELLHGGLWKRIYGFHVFIAEVALYNELKDVARIAKEMLLNNNQLIITAMPLKEGYLLSCFVTETSGIDLLSLFDEYGAAGSMTEVSCFYRKQEGDIKKNITDYLYRKMPLAATVAGIMSTPVKGFAPTTVVQDAYNMLDLNGYAAFPLLEGEFVRGIITAADIRKAFRHGFKESPVSDFITVVESLTEECSLAKALTLHIKHGSGLIPIVDYENKIKGVVTRTDLLRGLYKERYQAAFNAETFLPGGYDNINKLLKDRLSVYTLGLLQVIGQAADKHGVLVYVVGGFVRDIFLDLPNRDIDLAVEGDALIFAGKVKEILGGKLELNEEYGTAKLTAKNFKLDFVSARQEYYSLPAAKPSLVKTNIKKDLFRRDFTVNTMAFKINTSSFAQFSDYYNGLDDLKHKRIKVLYSLSFVEDPLRIIRALRYSSRLDFKLEENTLKLLRSAVRSKVLEKVTREKLTKELVLLFQEKGAVKILKRLFDEGILQQIFPKVTLTEENYRLSREIEETIRWRGKSEKGKINIFLLFICAILYNSTDISVVMPRLRRLNITRKETEEIVFILENAGSIGKLLENDKLSPEEVYSTFSPLSEEMRYFILAAAKDDIIWEHYYHYRRLKKIKAALNGRTLKELGYKPGPFYKRVLERIKIEKIKGNLKNLEDELKFIKEYFPLGGEDDT